MERGLPVVPTHKLFNALACVLNLRGVGKNAFQPLPLMRLGLLCRASAESNFTVVGQVVLEWLP